MLDNLKLHLWGFSDTYFEIRNRIINDVKSRCIVLTSDRYGICNKYITNFMPFICDIIGIKSVFDKKLISNDIHLIEYYKQIEYNNLIQVKHESFLYFLKEQHINYSIAGQDILTHSHGQLSVDEVFQLKYGDYTKINLVDIVIYPTTQTQIEFIYKKAVINKYKIIPYGGGTNVSGCLKIHKDAQFKLYISLDMRKYNQILVIDEVNHYAIIQSGACGIEIEQALNLRGFTTGHEPDSYEFSTLGGWISTYASGMRRNLYGNIEEIVIDFGYINEYSKIIGEYENGDYQNQYKLRDTIYPVRCSHGSKIGNLLLGHEGNLGIITDVIVNIKNIPQMKLYESILFHTITDGIKCLKEIQEDGLIPSSIRLVDNDQFKLGQALKPQKSWFNYCIDKLIK